MNSQEFAAFFLFSLTAAVTPGPSNLLVMNAGLRGGIRGGLNCLAGVVVGMALLMGLTVAGLGSVLIRTPGLLIAMKFLGAAVLLWLSWRIATAPMAKQGPESDPVGFWQALLFQWINPKSWIVSASAAASYGASMDVPLLTRSTAMTGTFVLAAAPAVALWLFFWSCTSTQTDRPAYSKNHPCGHGCHARVLSGDGADLTVHKVVSAGYGI